MDNILITYELTHYLMNKRGDDLGYVALKLDMSKAYDRVEWKFFENMMRRLGFVDPWIKLIMECTTSVSYRIKVNGELSTSFIPERGLQQGDPLSSYLFLLCAEAFSALLHEAKR